MTNEVQTVDNLTIEDLLKGNFYTPERIKDEMSGSAKKQKTKSDPKPKDKVSVRIARDLAEWGYDLWLNDMDDSIWDGNRCMDDVMRAELRTTARDAGYAENHLLTALDDVTLALAAKHRRNPATEYLDSLEWDGQDHIGKLATYFPDLHRPITYTKPDGTTETRTVFCAFLRRWLIGSVAKLHGDKDAIRANFVLTLVAPQGTGKSHLAAWLCPLPDLFVEKSINPDDKDHRLLRSTAMLWEIGELGATTKRADVEALKSFLTGTTNNERKAYGHFNTIKPCVASYVGTVNSDGAGFLTDTTGNRRFAVVEVPVINRSYDGEMSRDQVWAQAVALWKESPKGYRLLPEETVAQQDNNAEHMVPDVMGDALVRTYEIDPEQTDWRASSSEILDKVRSFGGISRGNDVHQARALSAALMQNWGIKGKRSNGATYYYGLKLRPNFGAVQ